MLLFGTAAARLAAANDGDPSKPTASFTVSDSSPLTGAMVKFDSTSSAGLLGGPIASEDWDLDNDGQFDDDSGSKSKRSFSTAGTYTVALQVTDTLGATDVATATITVQNRPPSADFSISPGTPSTLEAVTFESTSSDDDGTIASHAWDLDNDGNFNDGNGLQAQRSFPLPGAYTVRLLVTDNDGATDVATRTVEVGNQLPTASFDYSPASPSSGDEITLTSTSADADGTIVSYSWDLDGDGSFGDSTDSQAHVTFTTAGSHTVRLRVTDSGGDTATASRVIDVGNRPPSASFDVSPLTPKTGDSITFTSTSSDPDGSIDTYAWDLDDDGQFDDASGSSAQKSFSTPGTHTVRLRVTDDSGATDVAARAVDVGNRGPDASFSVSPQSPKTGEQITLSSTSDDADGTIVAYSWDLNGDNVFGDATTAQTQTSFATAGGHTVRLQVTDDAGESDVATVTITVANRAPTAAFGYSPSSPSTGEPITFTSSSTDPDGSIAAYGWDLDDDGQFDDSNASAVTTSFATSGGHTVRLRVTDDQGAQNTASSTVQIANRPPAASFTSSPASPKTGEQITFTSNSSDPDGTISAHAWDLDNDGQFDDASGSSAQRSFSTAGTYTVRLRVTDSGGATNVATGSVTVANRPPSASFTSSPASPKSGDPVTFDSTSFDPDGSLASLAWDLDNDGQFDDGAGDQALGVYAFPGTYTVRLLVIDDDGATEVATGTVTIANRAPTAGFDFTPAAPNTLEVVTFNSTATDPDGAIASYAWDLDNDGQYDDGATASVQRSFPVAGNYTVKLAVTDTSGASATVTKTVAVANQPPKASFTTSPDAPTTDGPVSFTSTSTDPENLPLTASWDLDNNGSFEATGATAQKQFTVPGTYTFKLKVVDASLASDIVTGTVVIPNRAPTATVDHSPKNPQTRQPITFTATASDPENRVKSIAWDIDEDGFDDGTGATLTKTYNKPGAYSVRFRIEDQDGSSVIVPDTVAVGNQAPKASFVVLPGSPVAGSAFSLVSTALDPDTPLDKWLWDLNGDGVYGDAQGPEVKHMFPAAGSYTIGLQVLDSEDVSDFSVQTVVVQPPPQPAPAAPQQVATGPAYQLLSPFPVVRLAGRIKGRGTRLRLFSIEAPPGARVVVTCRGRSCPFRLSARSAGAPSKGTNGKVRTSSSLRIRQLEKRVLKSGVTVTIYVTKAGTIGKYVKFTFRKRRPPARVDRCLMPNAPNKPVECPS